MVYFAAPQKQPPCRVRGVLGRKAMALERVIDGCDS